ncbi:N-6 DNA methylase [Asticcacaulis sp. BYS171W]|uniref:site-specific DNA-methyltransferase (adenine-specific) n=1 Tax=Asticcacaulis aquaticus TaxID=2984212 RepID=A0ABT5HYB6_9CAUL|nr:type ISP restriction/modification enzyme [Asticcacaulis aquaticus]MDC7685039.1 N-6 DNA methylase [Asticcacaulis aquaticus]
MAENLTFQSVIASFGQASKQKLSNVAISGAPEDQIRSPLEKLIKDLSLLAGYQSDQISLVGETTLSALATRPDYAVTVKDALVGFIEVKAPGKGSNPLNFTDEHDKKQWSKLCLLPNIIYTDGNSFSLWQDGKIQGEVIFLEGDVRKSGNLLKAPAALLSLVSNFLNWNPIVPNSTEQLAEITARLCRLLRDEVSEELERGNPGLTSLAAEWRALLFPNATDDQFADGYAQAVTFGLLVARARNIELKYGIERAAIELRKTNSLIATALRLLTDDPNNQKALNSALKALSRVLNEVNWSVLTHDDSDAWLYFYEDFLQAYDSRLKRKTGSYYTPPKVVEAMVRFVDEALRDENLFSLPQGFASKDVTVVDPAVGTGAYLLGALQKIAQTVRDDIGPGAVPAAIAASIERLIGFEMQFGPFAVAQLRLIAELHSLTANSIGEVAETRAPRLYVTDTLGDPYEATTHFSQMTQPIGESRRAANEIKRSEPITVVMGNPPYKDKAKGKGGWIEKGSTGYPSPMDLWSPPPEWGLSEHSKHLKNLYIFFWRWATWKVFGSGHELTTGEKCEDKSGVICFITASAFLDGPGFQRMREDLRKDCTKIWVINCTPEGHQPDVGTRIFQGVQQPIAIVLAVRKAGKDRSVAGDVVYKALPQGDRELKFTALSQTSLADKDWLEVPKGWRDSFLPEGSGAWTHFVPVADCFVESSSGVLPGRTWVVAPDVESLRKRWDRLVGEKDPQKKEDLFFPTLRDGQLADRHTKKVVKDGLVGHEHRAHSVAADDGPVVKPVRIGFRSFDRQWIIPDNRLLLSARPELWRSFGPRQAYLFALETRHPETGPALTVSGLLPDMNFYKGSSGGRVYPLWRDATGSLSNVQPALMTYLSELFEMQVGAEDVFAYICAVTAYPGFTRLFSSELVRPQIRFPLTAEKSLFLEAVEIGKEVAWLHCYGERFTDPQAGRPSSPPRLPKSDSPIITLEGAIPGSPSPLPDEISYDAGYRRLHIGGGYVENVSQQAFEYEVGGRNVIRQWFSYRKLDRSRPMIGERRQPSDLEKIAPDHWLDEYTTDLINLIHVLERLVRLETRQEELLQNICKSEIISFQKLQTEINIGISKNSKSKKVKNAHQSDLFN